MLIYCACAGKKGWKLFILHIKCTYFSNFKWKNSNQIEGHPTEMFRVTNIVKHIMYVGTFILIWLFNYGNVVIK